MGLRVNCGAKAGVGYYRELTHVAMTQRYHGPCATPSSPSSYQSRSDDRW
jgi:hypothetical protein